MIISRSENAVLRLKNGNFSLFNKILKIETILNQSTLSFWRMIDGRKTKERIILELYDGKQKELDSNLEKSAFDLLTTGMIKVNLDAVFLPYSFWKKRNLYAVYLPTERRALLVNKAFITAFQKVAVKNLSDLERVELDDEFRGILKRLKILNTPYDKTRYKDLLCRIPQAVTIMPTTDCNLNCVYCYAAKKYRNKYYLSKKIARAAIDYAVRNSMHTGVPGVNVGFMGGGEPTVNWDVLTDSVVYAKKVARQKRLPITINLTTNGFLARNQVEWIAKNFDTIKVSFDGIEEIQNKQRCAVNGNSFEIVSNTLKLLSEWKANFLIRITVTNDSISKLKDSIYHILENYSPNSIIINPVYVCGNCESNGIHSIEYKQLLEQVKGVQDIGSRYGIDIVMPYDKVTYMEVPNTPFCGFQKGYVFLTSDGYLSACSEVDGKNDKRVR